MRGAPLPLLVFAIAMALSSAGVLDAAEPRLGVQGLRAARERERMPTTVAAEGARFSRAGASAIGGCALAALAGALCTAPGATAPFFRALSDGLPRPGHK